MAEGFVRALLWEGRLRVGVEPQLRLSDADVEELRTALAIAALQLTGPLLQGSLPILVQAVPVVYRLARRFLHAEPEPAANDPTLRMPAGPRSAADHLAGDVAFRFLPGLYQRVVSRDPEDELVEAIKNVLRQWPLSGVLADITEPPATPIDFEGHPGLGFLYAERLAARERSAWMPTGAALDCLDVVYQSLGKTRSEA